jgi:GGDEF domain-containing protein
MPTTTAAGAKAKAARLRDRLMSITVPPIFESPINLSWSFGVAEYPGGDNDGQALFQMADVALSEAAVTGGGKIRVLNVGTADRSASAASEPLS